MVVATEPASAAPPPPPPLLGSSTSLGSSKQLSHPAWNSLVSDITMSEDEDGLHVHNDNNHPSKFCRPLVHNDDAAASLMEYSQSSEENFPNRRQRALQRSPDGNSSSGLLASALSSSSTCFRLREDVSSSCRVVRFSSSLGGNEGNSLSNAVAASTANAALPFQNLRNSDEPSDMPTRRHRHHHHHQQHHHRGGAVPMVSRETFLATPNRWVTQLAYSFRTPPAPRGRKQAAVDNGGRANLSEGSSKKASSRASKEKRKNSKGRNRLEIHQKSYQSRTMAVNGSHTWENTPLLPLKEEETSANPRNEHHRPTIKHEHEKLYAFIPLHRRPHDYVSMAAFFLKDYESARPPTLPSNVTWITPWHMGLYRLKYSTPYSILLGSATLALFLSSALEGPSPTDSTIRMHTLSALNLYALVVFASDMWILVQFQKTRRQNIHRTAPSKTMTALPVMAVQSRASQANMLTRPLCLFGIFLALENLGWLIAKPDRTFVVLYSSIGKPIVLYYISSQARHAMEALLRIAKIVIRVLVIEMILILSFAAVACRLFTDFGPFDHLSVAWLSLFKLATTVVNPSIWMPMYEKTHWSAVFFVLFIVVTVFYMHSLVLSVVFQTYIQAAAEIYDRSVTDREDALQLSYAALKRQHQHDARKQQQQDPHKQKSDCEARGTASSHPSFCSQNGIPMYLIREVLEILRPHYNAMKINALVEVFDTSNTSDLDYSTFRTKIRQALNASIRTARVASPLSMSIELTAVVVAVVNFMYVICLTSSFSTPWFDAVELQVGIIITVAGLAELLMRTNPFRVSNFTPMTRFNATFDGLAMLAAALSSVGIFMALAGRDDALEYVLMGRAVDMIRVMRFFQIFRDVVRRSADVLPALIGPLTLVMTMLHFFVYLGMAFWGGAINVGELTEDEITPLYDLNNFNSYLEGLVTMFQVLVVNDWHAIAEVFLYADRCSSPNIVFPFFVIGNLVGVSILLNVITAFFVESFVTKLNGDGGGERVSGTLVKDFSIKTSENSRVRRITSSHSLSCMGDDDFSDAHDADSEGSSDSSELFEFDVYEREGYDKIIQTVSGGQHQDDFAKQVCSHVELLESLTPGREKIGYLVCCQQTMNRYGNRRFESEADEYLGKVELHALVSDMHALLVLSSKESLGDRSLVRAFPHRSDPSKKLEVSATILRRHPALSLFVSRIMTD